MVPSLELIVKVQGLDLRAAELRKEIAALPKYIAEIEKALQSHNRKLEADRAVLEGNQKERRTLDGEVQVHHQKIAKLRDQMLSAKTNEQYRAFQHEIEFCEKAIRKAEDRLLEMMVESETLDKNVQAAEAALKAEKAEVERQNQFARKRSAEDQQALDVLLQERTAAVAGIEASSLAVYERIAKRYGGHAVSDATQGRCSACNLELRPQLFQDLRKGDRIYYCENCNRFLHYNPPVAFDEATGSPAPYAVGTRVDMS